MNTLIMIIQVSALSEAGSRLTFLKCVALCTFRTGAIIASRTTILISAPEKLGTKQISVKMKLKIN